MKYKLPLPSNVQTKMVQPTGIYSHKNYPESKYAIDFLVDVDTPVLAAREGIVWRTKSDSSEYGLDPKFSTKVNFVAIEHNDGTFAEYVHLGKDKIVVKVGQRVKVGDILGYTGLSGCMDLPHLHFNLFTVKNGRGISIPFKFE
jgi:murein DD-endopeptidase MepM/ murein hydrolase activator NlpD